eukprot:Gb_06718 [translate_table: standard]
MVVSTNYRSRDLNWLLPMKEACLPLQPIHTYLIDDTSDSFIWRVEQREQVNVCKAGGIEPEGGEAMKELMQPPLGKKDTFEDIYIVYGKMDCNLLTIASCECATPPYAYKVSASPNGSGTEANWRADDGYLSEI